MEFNSAFKGLILHEQTYTHDGKDSVEPTRIKIKLIVINPLNAELNPICHLLVLLGALWVAYATHSTLKPVPTLPR
jgi:hypothetical protein